MNVSQITAHSLPMGTNRLEHSQRQWPEPLSSEVAVGHIFRRGHSIELSGGLQESKYKNLKGFEWICLFP